MVSTVLLVREEEDKNYLYLWKTCALFSTDLTFDNAEPIWPWKSSRVRLPKSEGTKKVGPWQPAWIKCCGLWRKKKFHGNGTAQVYIFIKHASKFLKRLKGYLVCPPKVLFRSNNYGFSLRSDSFPGFCLAE